MTASSIVVRSIRFYWRTHLGVILGAALATMVLTGSLLVGDSVKATLRRQAELRIGKAGTAMLGGDRYFRDALAGEVGGEAAPMLMLRGSIARADGAARVNQAQVIGADARFWKLAPSSPPVSENQTATLNERAAAQLGVMAGDAVVVRVEKPGMFSRDAPLSGDEGEIVAIRANVGAVVSDQEFGRFSLQASQVPPFSVFVPLSMLQQRLKFEGRANLLLEPADRNEAPSLDTEIARRWTLADAALELRDVPKPGGLELRSPRVFLDRPIIDAAPRGTDALTYLVNEIRAGEKAAPYSMVTALDAPSSGFLPAELADDEITISEWLAEDLGVREGGKVTLKYFVMGERRQLEEQSREFTVLSVLPRNEPQLNSSWMPDFPGLADQKNCRDWKPGFAMDVTRIRDKDEAYWDQYRGTPKAFVNITVGQQMWANRWGELTAIRYPPEVKRETIEAALREKLTPEQLGFQFIPLREQAIAATKAPVDFGQLFVSFSFFLIVAAAVLTALLFVFSIEQRHTEAGLLLALGWPPRKVRRLFLAEGAALAVIGSLLGVASALIYTKLVLRGLATVWRGAVGTSEFVFAANPPTLGIGAISGVAIAVLAIWLASRKQFRHSARELLSGEIGVGAPPPRHAERSEEPQTSAFRGDPREEEPRAALSTRAAGKDKNQRFFASLKMTGGESAARRSNAQILAVICFGAAGAVALFAGGSAGAFFGAGSLLLIGGLFLALAGLRRAATAETGLEQLAQLGIRNAARRRGRSLATIAVLASGVFIVVAVDSFRHRESGPTAERRSGTGGFALIGESALPIYDDLNTAKGRETYALDDETMRDVSVVPMRVREGDDASCLNLNRALQPRLLGVKPGELDARGAFHTGWIGNRPLGWRGLDGHSGDEIITCITDAATLQWALQKELGDTIEYRDERGQPFMVRLDGVVKGSVLQGNVLISEQRFVEKFPSHGGYRFFLIDAPLERSDAVAQHFSRALSDRGFEVTPAWRRLAEFQAVENTYLSIFQVLGGLGLLLASAGLAIVVARNVLERRAEFGLLEAVGFRPGQLRRLVFAEHRWLLISGLLIGIASALLAVWPGLRERAAGFPLAEMSLLLAALAAGCVFWAWLATRIALRGSRIAALRSE